MPNMDFDWQIDEFMVYCHSTQLREKTMNSYEQALRLFQRWCMAYAIEYYVGMVQPDR